MSIERLRDRHVSAGLLDELAKSVGEELVDVVRLTDEEISLLDGPDADHVAPRPWFDALDPAQRETAMAVAARNLVIRGLALPSTLQDQTGTLTLALEDKVHAVLAARRAAIAVTFAQRRTSQTSSSCVLYSQPGGLVIQEEVTPGGLHIFRAGPMGPVIESLAGFCDPDEVAQSDGPHRTVLLADIVAGRDLPELTQALWTTAITAVLPAPAGATHERRLSTYACRNDLAVTAPHPTSSALTLRTVTRATLCGLLHDLLTPATNGPSDHPNVTTTEEGHP